MEFYPPMHDKGSDYSSVGRLNVLCVDEHVMIFEAMDTKRPGCYADGRYFHSDYFSE